MIVITAVPADYLEDTWPHVEGHLERAIDRSDAPFTLSSIKEDLKKKNISLWLAVDAEEMKTLGVVTARIIKYPKCKALVAEWIGGNRMSEWADECVKTLEQYARDNGCARMEGFGRKGWGRFLKKFGFRVWHPTYRKDL